MKKKQQGHILIVVLLLMLVGIFAITMAATLVVTTSQSHGSRLSSSNISSAAESGIENAILNVLRNPAYTGGTFLIDGLTVSTVVVPGTPTVITATATSSGQRHVYEATVDRVDGMLSITSWTQLE